MNPSALRSALSALAMLLLLGLAGCGSDPGDEAPSGSSDDTEGALTAQELAATPRLGPELEWDDLIPAEWRPDKLFEEFDIDTIDDDDPRADALMEKLETLWAEAPLVEALDGQTVRLPGFVVPLTTDATEIREFLLVPYFGACIHVPPPPPNQTVYVVTTADGAYAGELFDTVWVEGVMRIERFSNDLGEAGYRIDAVSVSPYEEDT
jgi:hypothetical protein